MATAHRPCPTEVPEHAFIEVANPDSTGRSGLHILNAVAGTEGVLKRSVIADYPGIALAFAIDPPSSGANDE